MYQCHFVFNTETNLSSHIPPAYVYDLGKHLCFFRPWIADSRTSSPIGGGSHPCFGQSSVPGSAMYLMAVPGERAYFYVVIPGTGIAYKPLHTSRDPMQEYVVETLNTISGMC